MYRNNLILGLVIFLNMAAGLCFAEDPILLKPGFQIYLGKDAPAPLQNAINILQRDLRNVLGEESIITYDPAQLNLKNSVVIVTGMLESEHLTVEKMEGFEEHKVFTRDGRVILQGADLRGTLYALFTFSEKFLHIKPLWYWASLRPEKKEQIEIPADFSFFSGTPYVKYRAWFPNDQDMFTPWRHSSDVNNGLWLETMLRLKLNTVNWNGNTFREPYAVSEDFKLIKRYGLYVTFHHHNPMNACFSGWEDYWAQYKKQSPPQLLLSNEEEIKSYWRYCVKSLVKNGMDVIWVINFRGNTDGPYWDTFKDAPAGMKERADVINRLVRDQIEIIKQETGESHPAIRMIFYNELSDLLAEGLLDPPIEDNMIWTFVAARRDHFPNDDLRNIDIPEGVNLGYYMNLQFTSTGSHLAQAEGPWKMEQNYRYVDSKNNRPLLFSELNAGNLREHLLSLSANAEMLWNFKEYKTDTFLRNFCNQYFGTEHGNAIAGLYKDFFYSYWNQKKSDLKGFERQYIFQDLRYQKAVGQIAKVFFDPYDPNPLKDFGNEQLQNRTFRIVPQDNGTRSQVDAILKGTDGSIAKLEKVTHEADVLYTTLDEDNKVFFDDNLRVQAHFMLNLNKTLHYYCLAYKNRKAAQQIQYLTKAYDSAVLAQKALDEAAHDDFASWYKEERIFNVKRFVKEIDDTLQRAKTLHQEESAMDYPFKPVPFSEVKISDGFWTPRLETSRKVTIPYCLERCEDTGRIDNFAIAGGLKDGFFKGARYNDSDVYKVIEGASYVLSARSDTGLEKYLDDLIVKIAAAQEDDGYLSTLRTITPELDINKTMETTQRQLDMYGKTRWSQCGQSHELYCAGHLYEAAAAHYQATGKKNLLEVALKNADLICKTFGPKPGQLRNVPGHQEIEIGLVKLYRLTGDRKYLDMAKFFIDERGHYNGRTVHRNDDGITWCQDDKPVLDQTEPYGHVVRAVYMYSAMADIAALTGDMKYAKAVDTIWDNLVSKHLYLIGSTGVEGYGEGFGPEYKLPNQQAYNETCATVGLAFLNQRLFLLHGDGKYIDVLERSLYNGVLSGVSLEGNTFFYPNPLASDGKNQKHLRSPWFKTACCPSTIARFMPSLGGYIYAYENEDLYVNLYIGSVSKIKLKNQAVTITQQTDYPWESVVNIKVDPEKTGRFDILVRIPSWTQNRPMPSDLYRYIDTCDEKVTLKVNGKSVAFTIDKGYVRLHRTWKTGDAITLNMPMPVRRVLSHEKVGDNSGSVALERGPVVYCAEWPDNNGKALDIVLADNVMLTPEYRKDLLGGLPLIKGKLDNEAPFTAIPYYAWAHRGSGEMAVWLKRK